MSTERKVLVLPDRSDVEIARRACVDVSVLPGLKDATVKDLDRVAAVLRSALDKEGTEREEWRVVSREGGQDVVLVRPELLPDAATAKSERANFARPRLGYAFVRVQSRTITTFEDGAEYRTAWRDLEGENA